MNAWITEFINQFGYFAIALLIALENVLNKSTAGSYQRYQQTT